MNACKSQCGFLLFLVALLVSCQRNYEETTVDFSRYLVEEGLQIQAIAAEPLIEAPVDMSFDDQGRMWVLEMRGYMRNLAGSDEDDPVGRIVILQDRDHDGQADHVKVFMDSLKLARAISHVYGGLLYAEPPNLWFVNIDQRLGPGKKVLVDSAYAVGGNVEHQPNGLMMNIDNWIYSAKGTKRYRRVNGEWVVEDTSFRGQWGITHDPFGRLLYNDNSNQLTGDYVLPNVLNHHPAFRQKHAIGKSIVTDQRVYPLQPTPVNRGYQAGVLDEEGKLRNVTSACGPVYFQGTALAPKHDRNAFVCVPEANLVKRNVIVHDGFTLNGKQALQGSEFLATTDLGFRPVNLKNGPDGALYVADMHRGIIQHKTYMTSYLRDKLMETGLDSLTGKGRILRISREAVPYRQVDLTTFSVQDLVDSLLSSNAHVRDRAQQLIIRQADESSVTHLRELVLEGDNAVASVQALYCLEALDRLEVLKLDITQYTRHPWLLTHLFALSARYEMEIAGYEDLVLGDSIVDYHVMYYASSIGDAPTINRIAHNYENREWILEPVYSAFSGSIEMIEDSSVKARLEELQSWKPQANNDALVEYRGLTPGLLLYRSHCALCHGQDGGGLQRLGPPLLNSEYVSGNPERLANIIMYGLTGDITIDGEVYSFMTPMPGLKANYEIDDEEIRYIINYIRNAFVTADIVPPGDLVRKVRELDRDATSLFTVEELSTLYD